MKINMYNHVNNITSHSKHNHLVEYYVTSLFNDNLQRLLNYIDKEFKTLQPVNLVIIKAHISNMFTNQRKALMRYVKDILMHYSYDRHPKTLKHMIHLHEPIALTNIFDSIAYLIHHHFDDFMKHRRVKSNVYHHKKELSLKTYQQLYQRYHTHQRFVHIWVIENDRIKHIAQSNNMVNISFETMVFNTFQVNVTHHILPEPEDVIVLERWYYKYIKNRSKTYVLWLLNDALMTHIHHIPRSLEVVVDLDVLMEDLCLSKDTVSLSIHEFNQEVVPSLREMHQYFRIKKIKHYVVGKALEQRHIFYRCLTLGFRHVIIQPNDIHEAILEAQAFIEPRYLKKI